MQTQAHEKKQFIHLAVWLRCELGHEPLSMTTDTLARRLAMLFRNTSRIPTHFMLLRFNWDEWLVQNEALVLNNARLHLPCVSVWCLSASVAG